MSSPRKRWSTGRALVADIEARADEPWTALTLAGSQLVAVRAGGIVLLIGPTGRGKSSLALELLAEHAENAGPAIAMSLELPSDELIARAVGARRNASWAEVLTGKVPRADMLSALPERLLVIDRDHATLDVLAEAIDDVRAIYTAEPVLVAIDYVQILEADEGDIRPRVGRVMRAIDRLARDRRVVVLVLSQGSRSSSRALSAGELLGAQTIDAGAEAADLERWSTMTLAIGALGKPTDDDTAHVELSIGKGRMSGGDRVVPARFCGRTGRWRLTGEARPAAAVRAERAAERDATAARRVALAIPDILAKADAPMSRREIRAALGGRDGDVRRAVTELLSAPKSRVVEVEPSVRGACRLWSRDRATAAGLTFKSNASECIPLHLGTRSDAMCSASRPLVGADADALTSAPIQRDALGPGCPERSDGTRPPGYEGKECPR